MESFLCSRITLAVLSIEEKMPEEKEILNILDRWLEMSFLSNVNILVGILLGPTDFLEFNKDMTFSISVLSVGLTKKGNIRSIFKKIWEMFMWEGNIKLRFTNNWRKIVVENIEDFHWIGNSSTINSKSLRDFSRNVFNI